MSETRVPLAALPDDLPVHNNLVRTTYNNPEMHRGFASLSGRVHSASHLGARTRELVILQTAARLGAEYEWTNHVPAAKAAGGDDNSGASAGSGASGAGTMQKKATGMKKTDMTTCAPGQVWDKKTRKCLERHSGVLPDSDLTEYAYSLAKADRYQEAIDVLDILDNPNTPRALNYRGYATRKLGRTDEGIGYYLKSVALDQTIRRSANISATVIQGQVRPRQRSTGDDREALRIEGVRVLRGSRRRSEDGARSLMGAASGVTETKRRARDFR
jgi:tetratricopeptide (TPR) repeat protein